jgi:hypothetical protein
MDDRWLWGALALVLVVVGVVLWAPHRQEMRVPGGDLPATTSAPLSGAQSGRVALVPRREPTSPIPLVDAVGANDLDKVPRYPGAKALESDREPKFGLSMSRYIVAATPVDVGRFYVLHYAGADYRIDDTGMLANNGTGWWGNFTSPDNRTSVAIFAISEWIDTPIDDLDNPTTITVIKTDGDELDVQALLAQLGASEEVGQVPAQ